MAGSAVNKRRLGCLLAVVAVFGLLGVAAVVAVVVLLPPFVTRLAIREARERGVELVPGEVEFGLGWILVRDAKFSLIGVRGIQGRARRVDVELDGFDARRVEARGVTVDVVGSAATLALEVGEWARAYPRTFRMVVAARDVQVTWRPEPGAQPFLTLEGGAITPRGKGGVFEASRATLSGVDLGKIGAEWSEEQSTVSLGLGATSLGEAPVVARVQHAATPPTADITLRPTPIERLAGPLAVPLPVAGVTVSGEAKLEFAPGISSGPVDGTVMLVLDGWVPPHPRELDGFVFGKKTTFQTKFHVPEDRKRADLTESRVQAGGFRLDGGGVITRQNSHARVELKLQGRLPCVALAGAAAESYLGRTIGKFVGAAAAYALQGAVAVIVRIDADTRDLPNAKVLRTIGVGCGLKPFPIDVPELLRDLPKLVPSFPTELPSIPTGLPTMPQLFPPGTAEKPPAQAP